MRIQGNRRGLNPRQPDPQSAGNVETSAGYVIPLVVGGSRKPRQNDRNRTRCGNVRQWASRRLWGEW
jgi:hypothetical protein